mmetsp:Transcript_59627/g.124567  ORF Transcript_59627/g.124567 Transcript_59627/m.124567 type:complete len:87 (+) Transcript_59627:299-559(+)
MVSLRAQKRKETNANFIGRRFRNGNICGGRHQCLELSLCFRMKMGYFPFNNTYRKKIGQVSQRETCTLLPSSKSGECPHSPVDDLT